MSVISQDVVERVVADVSERMNDPRYGQVRIGEFVEAHPEAAQYLATVVGRRVGAEAVMHAVFHAAVLAGCVTDGAGAPDRTVSFVALDAVAGDPVPTLHAAEPALHDYLLANVDEQGAHDPLARVALALVAATDGASA